MLWAAIRQTGKIYFLKVYDKIEYFPVLVGLRKLKFYRGFTSTYMHMYAIFSLLCRKIEIGQSHEEVKM